MPLTLLIVEEPSSRYGPCLEALLQDRFDAIATVESSADAVEVAVQLRPDVVITPFPAVTRQGQLLCAMLKNDPRTSGCRLLAYSHWPWANTRADAMQEWCDAYVSAAAPVEELLAAVDRVVGLLPSGSSPNGNDTGAGVPTGGKRSLVAEARVRRAAEYRWSREKA